MTAVAAACSGQQPLVSEVFNDAFCEELEQGVSEINFEQLTQLRGSRLLAGPGQTEIPPVQASLPNVALVAIYPGSRPTAGYSLKLQETTQRANHLRLRYMMRTPPADAAVAQVVTHPCSVVQIDYAAAPSQRQQQPNGAVSASIDGLIIGELSF